MLLLLHAHLNMTQACNEPSTPQGCYQLVSTAAGAAAPAAAPAADLLFNMLEDDVTLQSATLATKLHLGWVCSQQDESARNGEQLFVRLPTLAEAGTKPMQKFKVPAECCVGCWAMHVNQNTSVKHAVQPLVTPYYT
jgi:hypothetical protein